MNEQSFLDIQEAYRLMFLIRHTEEEIVNRYRKYELMRCPVHLSIGQESAAVGVIMALDKEDHVYSNHRSHAHYLAKLGNLDAMIAELYGKSTGSTGGWGGSMHLADESCGFMGASPGVGDTVSMAIGSALAFKMDKTDRVSVAFFGDSAVETGQFWEASNFASLHKLPIMFVCENNQYATATHISKRQPNSNIYERVSPFMWSQWVKDDDISQVYNAARQCRSMGPGFLEIETYRYREHVGPDYDWDFGYRTEEEVKEHMASDPLLMVRNQLSDNQAKSIEKEIMKRVAVAFAQAEQDPWPEPFL